MGRAATKVAVSVPAELFKAVEGARRRSKQTRSAVVQEALRQWLRQQTEAGLVREYEAGYRRRPERKAEIDAATAAAVGLLGGEDDW